MKNAKLHLVLFQLLCLSSGCSTSGKSTMAGAGIGAGLGAGVGAMVDPGPKGENRIRNVFIGSTAGALVGAGGGYLTHQGISKKEDEAYEKGKKDGKTSAIEFTPNSAEPVLIPAKVEARFVDDQVRGSVFVPAHFEYRIVEPARWSK